MALFDIDLQRMSLGALVIALGMMVDNAIVVADGMAVRLQQGMDRTQAAIESARVPAMPRAEQSGGRQREMKDPPHYGRELAPGKDRPVSAPASPTLIALTGRTGSSVTGSPRSQRRKHDGHPGQYSYDNPV